MPTATVIQTWSWDYVCVTKFAANLRRMQASVGRSVLATVPNWMKSASWQVFGSGSSGCLTTAIVPGDVSAGDAPDTLRAMKSSQLEWLRDFPESFAARVTQVEQVSDVDDRRSRGLRTLSEL